MQLRKDGYSGRTNPLEESKNLLRKYGVLRRYEIAAKYLKGKILEVGCGYGYSCNFCKQKGKDVVGIDSEIIEIDTTSHYIKKLVSMEKRTKEVYKCT